MHTAERRRTIAEKLGLQFLDEVQAAIAPFEIYGDAHDELWLGYFDPLRPFIRQGDFVAEHPLSRPHPLQLLVESYTFYGWFRVWLRKQGIDPGSLLVTSSYPFTTACDKKYPDDDDNG
jgi:hypothetical protein